MAGVDLVILLTLNIWFPLGLGPDPALWAVLTLAALTGAVCAYPAQLWIAGRGLVRWQVAEEPVTRRLRWYEALAVVILSYGGVVVANLGALVIISGLSLGEIVRLLASGA